MIVVILVIGFLFRLINLNQSLWLDEAISVLAVKNNSFWQLVTQFAPGDFHPPLYYLILKFWDSFFGYGEISSRFLSVVFGTMAVAFVYLIGKRLFSKKVGLVAALFLSVNPLAVYYSQEARMYALVMLAVTAAVYFFVSKRRWWFTLAFLVALYADYLPWLLIPVFLPDSLLVLAFTLPWLPFLWGQLRIGTAVNPAWAQILGQFSLKAVLLVPVKFIFGRIPTQIIFSIPVLVYFWLMHRVRNKLLWAWLLAPLILGLIISLKIPVFSYFRFLFVLPAFILLLAAGTQKHRWAVPLVVTVSVVCLVVFNFDSRFWREDWRGAVAYMKGELGIVLMPSLAQDAPIRYYNPAQPVFDRSDLVLSGQSPVYLLRYVQEIFDPQDQERTALESAGYKKTSEKDFNGVVIWKYQQ
ncbi:MAG: glycosyltransferase family 39 protein [Patescibacteria group bacterium]|nr:glycosyltransferase family 39 protein [Patescibacteria group bacterium]MCL5431695.1 glycosyltransferase family 39 protein [Patescibacteria group bacterium]